jgi:hypothetical protein
MTTPLNLNKIRKERGRTSRKKRADENSVQFGQSKTQKEALKARAEQMARNLSGHKIET